MVGVPYSSLRYYERIGLLAPSQSEENRYREYTYGDAFRINKFKMYRSLGFSTEAALKLMASKNSEELLDILKKKEVELCLELEILKRRLAYLEKTKEDFLLLNKDKSFRIVFEGHKLFLMGPKGIGVKTLDSGLLAEWVELLPITTYGGRIKLSSITQDHKMRRDYGIAIDCEDSKFLSPKAREAADILTLGTSLSFFCEHMPQGSIDPLRLKEALGYIKEQGYFISGDIYLRSLPVDNQEGHKSCMVYIPIEKENKKY